MKTHELKVHPQFWEPLVCGHKPFEMRRDDRHFAVGDILVLRRYDPSFGYSEMRVTRQITYMLHAEDLPNAIMPGYVVLGLASPYLDDGK